MTLDELRELRAILKTCGIAHEGSDAADEGPNTLRDLERLHRYVIALQERALETRSDP